MDLEQLDNYIKGKITANSFTKEIREEIIEFINNVKSETSVNIIYGDEASYAEFGSNRLLKLLYKYLDKEILEWELEYILRLIEFQFEEEDQRVDDVIFSFSDPFLNYNINDFNIESAILYLTGSIEKMILKKGKKEVLRHDYNSVFF